MIPILIDGPAVEPVGLPDMAAHLRLDDDAEHELVAALIKAARLLVEAASRRVLIAQSWRFTLDAWPHGRIVSLPVSPVLAITQVQVVNAAGTAVAVPLEAVQLEAGSDPPRIRIGAAAPDPGAAQGGIRIDVEAGFGAAPEDVPEPLRLAIRMLVGGWFENRGDIVVEETLAPEVQALVAPYRRVRL
jgi:uncharacterized phiE125 gp8 family phage protein